MGLSLKNTHEEISIAPVKLSEECYDAISFWVALRLLKLRWDQEELEESIFLPPVRDSPVRVLDVVAVTVVRPVLARLTGEVHLDLTEGAQFRPSNISQGETESYLVPEKKWQKYSHWLEVN